MCKCSYLKKYDSVFGRPGGCVFYWVPKCTRVGSLGWSLCGQAGLWTTVEQGWSQVTELLQGQQLGPRPAGLLPVVQMGVVPPRSLERRDW